MQHHFDVLTVTDCRLPGGTASSTAEEINAQARTDLRSGLLHVDSPLVSRSRPMNARLRRHVQIGHATQVLPVDHVDCDLVVIRHPKVALAIEPSRAPTVRTPQCVVVVNQVPTVHGDEVYELAAVAEAVERWLGVRPRFAPIGPLVRSAVVAHDPTCDLEPTDWVNVIDVDEWRSRRSFDLRSPIVIGRHSRDHYIKFPNSRQALLAAYPTSSDFNVHMLGGRKQVGQLLGAELPSNWRIHEFDSIDPRRFLESLDVYAYFHHPDLIEAFGRNMLEALAVGVPVVTHAHFTDLFGDAITPATPQEASRTVRDLVGDRLRYRDQVDRGRELAETRFSYRTHVERVESLLGRSIRTRPSSTSPAAEAPTKPTALFIGPNGAGLGHLTRLMALARRSRNLWNPHFLTFSMAAGVVESQGFPVTYVPSRSVTGSTSTTWHTALAERLDDLLAEIRPSVVVIDSTEPYRGLLMCLRDHPEIPVVWSRRGMWKAGVSNAMIESGEDFFDLVIEPGDLASESDSGATKRSTAARPVGPITFLDGDELHSRSVARELLGVVDGETAVLIQLGAGNINDTTDELQAVLEGLTDFTAVRPFVVKGPITASLGSNDAHVTELAHFPLAQLMPGFDLAVAAAGYNTFHELMLAGVPTVLLPNTATITDDQEARARWAATRGLAVLPDSGAATDIELALKHLSVDENRHVLRSDLGRLEWHSGGDAAVRMIDELVDGFDHDDESNRRQRRHRAFEAVEASIERRAARKRSRSRAKNSAPRRRATAGTIRRLSVGLVRRGKRVALRRLGYQRLLAMFTLLPEGARRRVERATGTTPGRVHADPSRLRVPPGRLIDDADESLLASILLVVSPDVDNDSLADAIAHLQTTMRNFRPLFLTTSLQADGFRRFGFAWEQGATRSQQMERVLQWYRPDFVVEVDDVARIADPDSAFQGWLRSRPVP